MRAQPIFEDSALRWFFTYALVCSLTGIAILFVMHKLAPFEVDKPAEREIVAEPTPPASVRPAEPGFAGKPDEPEVVTRSTPPAIVRSPAEVARPTGPEAVRPNVPSVVGPAEPALRGPFEPVIIKKSDRLGQ